MIKKPIIILYYILITLTGYVFLLVAASSDLNQILGCLNHSDHEMTHCHCCCTV